MRDVTIKDIAQKAGVSYAQVSRALNGKYGVSKETSDRIFEIAEEIGYLPNTLARSLVKKKSTNIALIIPDIANPYFSEIALSIITSADKLGYQTIICNSFWNVNTQKAAIISMIQNRVAGIIIKPVSDDFEFLNFIDIPVVLLNSCYTENVSCVEIDNRTAEYKATEFLINNGYKKIAYIGGRDSLSNPDRLNGYKDALTDYKIKIKKFYIQSGDFNIESGYNLIKKIFEAGLIPDAVVCGNDVIALGVLQYAEEKAINIPNQLGVIGFDNIELSVLPQINLTTVEQPRKKMGYEAVRILLNNINSGNEKIEKMIFSTDLIIRSTTRKKV